MQVALKEKGRKKEGKKGKKNENRKKKRKKKKEGFFTCVIWLDGSREMEFEGEERRREGGDLVTR